MQQDRLRVLLVPDNRYWILGRIATAIAGANEWIAPTVITGKVLQDLMERDAAAVGPFDLMHFVAPHTCQPVIDAFGDDVPVVTSLHHFDGTQPLQEIRRGDVTCVAATEWQDWLAEQEWPAERLFLMPYGVDTTAFRPWSEQAVARTRRRLGISPGSAVVGFVGKPPPGAESRKGGDVFFAATLLLRRHVPSLTALVIGPGWGTLIDELRAAGIECVNLPFVLGHSDLCRLYAAMDLYWVTARIEGGPCTMLEAMSSGTCVVTTPVGMARDIVQDGVNAVLVPKDDPEAVADRSGELLADPERRRRIADAGRATVLSGFAWEQAAVAAWRLYQVAIGNWESRTGRRGAVSRMPTQEPGTRRSIDWGAFHLAGVRPDLRAWVRAKEHVLGMQMLAKLGAPAAAARLALRAVQCQPLEPDIRWAVQKAFPDALIWKAGRAVRRWVRQGGKAAAETSPQDDDAPIGS